MSAAFATLKYASLYTLLVYIGINVMKEIFSAIDFMKIIEDLSSLSMDFIGFIGTT